MRVPPTVKRIRLVSAFSGRRSGVVRTQERGNGSSCVDKLAVWSEAVTLPMVRLRGRERVLCWCCVVESTAAFSLAAFVAAAFVSAAAFLSAVLVAFSVAALMAAAFFSAALVWRRRFRASRVRGWYVTAGGTGGTTGRGTSGTSVGTGEGVGTLGSGSVGTGGAGATIGSVATAEDRATPGSTGKPGGIVGVGSGSCVDA
jgi:hypothetical protein